MDSLKKYLYALIFMIGMAIWAQSGSFQRFLIGFGSAISQLNNAFSGMDAVVGVAMSGVGVLIGAMVYSVFRE